MQSLRIATMVKGYITSPQPADIIYAPIELAVAHSKRLAGQGHQVTYFGPRGTHIDGVQIETLDQPALVTDQPSYTAALFNPGYSAKNELALHDAYLAREMFVRAKAGEYDLLHFHHPEVALPYAALFPEVPVVYTLHDPVSRSLCDAWRRFGSANQHFVSISDQQRLAGPELPYAATVYNGVDTDLFAPVGTPDDYLLFAARLVPEKGAHIAIQVAEATGRRLIIAGPVYDDYQDYFDMQIKPHLNKHIVYKGSVNREEMVRLYQHAAAFLMPIDWEEPFGLTMVEAMSCGVPVIAMRRGSVPEIVIEGYTGFVVDSAEQMVAAVSRIGDIDREKCRENIVGKFSLSAMTAGYAAAYQLVAGK